MYNNNNWKYNSRSLYTSNDNYKLPSFQWQKQTEIVNDFNNELVRGFSKGLSLYSPEQDLKLFNKLDLEPIRTDNVNFDKINAITQENYNKNDDIYNNTKSVIAGVVDQINKTSNDTLENLKNTFNIETSNIKVYIGLFIMFLIINK